MPKCSHSSKVKLVTKHEVCKSGIIDLRVDFCHLDSKSRANHLEHFRIAKKFERGLHIEVWAHLVRGDLM